jgi:2,5-dihydroxypyridine 5,6-dioxygenase
MTGDLLPLFQRELQLCRVKDGEVVALLTDPTTRRDYVDTAAGAARSLGADVFEIGVGGLGWDTPVPVKGMGASVAPLAKPSPLLEAVAAALSRAQLVLDLVPETIIHVDLRSQLQRAGVRILTVIEAPDILERLFPPAGIKDAVTAMGARLEATTLLRATSAAGTDVTYSLRNVPAITQYGYADEPGRWDHWPSALAVAYPEDGSASGTVVLQPGDLIFPFKRVVGSAVTMTIEDGYVTAIDGDADAFLLRDFLEAWDEPEVFATSHIGLGLLPRARWSAMTLYDKAEMLGMDGRSVQGNFLFSTGPNRFTGRHVEAHVDIPMHGCDVYLDDDRIIAGGRPMAAEFRLAATMA